MTDIRMAPREARVVVYEMELISYIPADWQEAVKNHGRWPPRTPRSAPPVP